VWSYFEASPVRRFSLPPRWVLKIHHGGMRLEISGAAILRNTSENKFSGSAHSLPCPDIGVNIRNFEFRVKILENPHTL
jgi:hypothetical protein